MEQFIKLIAELLELRENEVTDGLSIQNTDTWNSLKHMQLVITLEQTYAVQFTADEIVSMNSIGNIKQVLRGRGVVI
jgi:acyl carrier protein